MTKQPSSEFSDAAGRSVEFPLKFGSILEKGFPKGSTISLYGSIGSGKTVFCENLAKGFLNTGAGCVYIATERTPADIRSDFRTLRIDASKAEEQGKLAFIDGYSWLAGGSNEEFRVENLANLSELLTITERAYIHLNLKGLLILDSVSPLCLHNPEDDVTKFLQLLSAKTKSWEAIGVFVVQAGVHSEGFYNALAYLVDGMFDLRQEEENGMVKRYFRIRNLRFSAHGVGWMPFIIEADRDFKLEKESEISKKAYTDGQTIAH